ncbi:MAG TPA: EamA family transporter [Candidatus Woesebacteria bacterium]|nr:EamA family transporter [Candidatus Woesebacteria bacterium]
MFFKSKPQMGPYLIMVAASLWAIDAVFRTQLTTSIPSSAIVFLEHTIGFLILSPIFFKNWDNIKKLSKAEWLNFIVLTIISSVLGAILFTQALSKSFAEFDFVTPILLQKLQPVFVVILSAIFLKEKITSRFIAFAILALVGSYMMTFGTEIVQLTLQGKELVFVLALGAALCWGGGTILSKKALKTLNFPAATAMRFLLAIPISLMFMFIFNQTYNIAQISLDQIWRLLIIASVTGGAGAIFLYYKGLQNTDAKVSTFAELMLPLVSLLIALTALNPYGAPQKLTVANAMGIVLLVVSILVISLEHNKRQTTILEEK